MVALLNLYEIAVIKYSGIPTFHHSKCVRSEPGSKTHCGVEKSELAIEEIQQRPAAACNIIGNDHFGNSHLQDIFCRALNRNSERISRGDWTCHVKEDV